MASARTVVRDGTKPRLAFDPHKRASTPPAPKMRPPVPPVKTSGGELNSTWRQSSLKASPPCSTVIIERPSAPAPMTPVPSPPRKFIPSTEIAWVTSIENGRKVAHKRSVLDESLQSPKHMMPSPIKLLPSSLSSSGSDGIDISTILSLSRREACRKQSSNTVETALNGKDDRFDSPGMSVRHPRQAAFKLHGPRSTYNLKTPPRLPRNIKNDHRPILAYLSSPGPKGEELILADDRGRSVSLDQQSMDTSMETPHGIMSPKSARIRELERENRMLRQLFPKSSDGSGFNQVFSGQKSPRLVQRKTKTDALMPRAPDTTRGHSSFATVRVVDASNTITDPSTRVLLNDFDTTVGDTKQCSEVLNNSDACVRTEPAAPSGRAPFPPQRGDDSKRDYRTRFTAPRTADQAEKSANSHRFFVACEEGHLANVRRFLDVDSCGLNNFTGLHFAARKNRLPVAKLLIKHQADVNARTKNGWTPLMLACSQGHYKLVKLLLEAKAGVAYSSLDEKSKAMDLAKTSPRHARQIVQLLSRSKDSRRKNSCSLS